MPLNYTLQVVSMVNFMLCILYYILKKNIKTDIKSQNPKIDKMLQITFS